MSSQEFDLFVLGAGSAGVRAARLASGRGWRVGIAENLELGGTCVHRGCIPKKLYHYAAQIANEMKLAKAYGFSVPYQFAWKKLQENKDRELSRLGNLYKNTLENAQVEIFPSLAKISKPGEVSFVGAGNGYRHGYREQPQSVRAKNILIATGATPVRPDPSLFHKAGAAAAADTNANANANTDTNTDANTNADFHERIVTSDEFFHNLELPKRLAIYGSGYIGMEFACLLQALGVQVTVITRSSKILRKFDSGVSEFFARQLKQQNIAVHLNSEIRAICSAPDNPEGLQLSIRQAGSETRTGKSGGKTRRKSGGQTESQTQQLQFDALFWAIGRTPNLANLGLEELGVALNERGAIAVDAQWQTNIPGIYAIGDVIDQLQLTPVAIAQAKSFVQQHFPIKRQGTAQGGAQVGGIPSWNATEAATAIFTIPNIATVGLSEQAARSQNIPIQIYERQFCTLKESLAESFPNMFLRLIVHANSGLVLGIHGVGDGISEMIQCLAVAMQSGLKKQDFDETLPIHPTSSEEFLNMPLLQTKE